MTKRSKIFLGLMTLFSVVYNLTLPLHPDEAYYWVWSRNLQLSYFDHPPMVAYLIKLVTTLGNNEFAIRLVAILSTSIAAFLIYKLAREMFNDQVAEKSLIIFLLLPIVQAGYIVVTPDSPLVLFWTLTFYFFYKYVFKGEIKASYLAGIMGGCLLLSKYTGVLLFPALFLFILFSKRWDLFKKKEVYISLILVFIVFLPVLIWNYNHDWISFKFQYSHGAGGQAFKLSRVGEFIGGQVGIANPVFFLGLFYLLIRNFKEVINDKRLQFLFWPFIFTLVFFMYHWGFKSGEVNWTGPAYISAPILLAYWIDKFKMKKLYWSGIVISIILITLVRFPEVVPNLPKEAALKRKFMGYKTIFKQAGKYVEKDEVVLSNSYQHASEAQFYLPGQPNSYIIVKTRFSNYDFWSEEVKQKAKNRQISKAVHIGSHKRKEELEKYFAEVRLETVLKYQGKYINRKFYLYKCRN